MSELIHTFHDNSIIPTKENDLKLLVLTILAYTEELQEVII